MLCSYQEHARAASTAKALAMKFPASQPARPPNIGGEDPVQPQKQAAAPALPKHSTDKDWHVLPADEVVRRLAADSGQGLQDAEAGRRLTEHGPNELRDDTGRRPWAILWEQVTSTLVVCLILAAIAAAALGELKDALSILAIVALNTALGFHQEYRAQKAIEALKKIAVPKASVRRNGSVRLLPATEIVPGDIVLLEAGNVVPADCRVLESANLRTLEAILTGESQPVEKDPAQLEDAALPLGDRRNLAYMGTVVTYGRGVGVVTETGMNTEIGSIATMILNVESGPTPLQRRLDQLGRRLVIIAVALVGILFAAGVARGETFTTMFLTAISMAVAAVPEGLPAMVTIALALSAQRMARRQVLIRKLPAVEALGSVTVICSDKTGTLTENRISVAAIHLGGRRLDFDNDSLRSTSASDWLRKQNLPPAESTALGLLLTAGALQRCRLHPGCGRGSGYSGSWRPHRSGAAGSGSAARLRKTRSGSAVSPHGREPL
jgi:Ca2+-transporting ATPase